MVFIHFNDFECFKGFESFGHLYSFAYFLTVFDCIDNFSFLCGDFKNCDSCFGRFGGFGGFES